MPQDCKNCEAPIDSNASHISAGDCRAAQRKEIRRLRADNDHLRGVVKELETQTHPSHQILAPNGSAAPPAPRYTFADNVFKIG